MKTNVLKFQMLTEKKHLIHCLFGNFAEGYSGLLRELMCILATAIMIFVGLVLMFGSRFFAAKTYILPEEMQQVLLARVGFPVPLTNTQELGVFFLSALLFALSLRLLTLLFHRLPPPANWLIAPLPLILLIWCLNKLAVQTALVQMMFARSADNLLVDVNMAATFGLIAGFAIPCLYLWCYGASRPNEKTDMASQITA